MRVIAKMNSANQILHRTGFNKGGAVQQFWTESVVDRMYPYLPYQAANSVRKAMRNGTDIRSGIITVALPYAKYLYYGKVMIGRAPKQLTDKNLSYTKLHNPKAGPFWERRMLAEQKEPLMQGLYRFIGKKR